MAHRWRKSNTLLFVVFLIVVSIAGVMIISQRNGSFSAKRKTSQPPATIENVVLRIESNIMRAQSIMEELVFSEYASDLSRNVKAVNQMEETIHKDFEAMGKQFRGDNKQYLLAISSFREWKEIRDEIIKLILNDSSMKAKKMLRGKSASQVLKIRDALTALNAFSQKRADDYNPGIASRD